MAISVDVKRDKAVTTTDYALSLVVGTVTETDASDKFFIPIRTGTIDPDSFTVASCATTNNSTTVTTTGNGFLNVKVGNAVSGTGIAGGTTVSAKTDNNTITLSANATATGTVTLTFDPGSLTATLYGLEVTLVKDSTGKKLTPTIVLHKYDGSLGNTAGSTSNSTLSTTLVSSESANVQVDIDAFLQNLQVLRT